MAGGERSRGGGIDDSKYLNFMDQMINKLTQLDGAKATVEVDTSSVDKAQKKIEKFGDSVEGVNSSVQKMNKTLGKQGQMNYFATQEKMIEHLTDAWESYNKAISDDEKKKQKGFVMRWANAYRAMDYEKENIKPEIFKMADEYYASFNNKGGNSQSIFSVEELREVFQQALAQAYDIHKSDNYWPGRNGTKNASKRALQQEIAAVEKQKDRERKALSIKDLYDIDESGLKERIQTLRDTLSNLIEKHPGRGGFGKVDAQKYVEGYMELESYLQKFGKSIPKELSDLHNAMLSRGKFSKVFKEIKADQDLDNPINKGEKKGISFSAARNAVFGSEDKQGRFDRNMAQFLDNAAGYQVAKRKTQQGESKPAEEVRETAKALDERADAQARVNKEESKGASKQQQRQTTEDAKDAAEALGEQSNAQREVNKEEAVSQGAGKSKKTAEDAKEAKEALDEQKKAQEEVNKTEQSHGNKSSKETAETAREAAAALGDQKKAQEDVNQSQKSGSSDNQGEKVAEGAKHAADALGEQKKAQDAVNNSQTDGAKMQAGSSAAETAKETEDALKGQAKAQEEVNKQQSASNTDGIEQQAQAAKTLKEQYEEAIAVLQELQKRQAQLDGQLSQQDNAYARAIKAKRNNDLFGTENGKDLQTAEDFARVIRETALDKTLDKDHRFDKMSAYFGLAKELGFNMGHITSTRKDGTKVVTDARYINRYNEMKREALGPAPGEADEIRRQLNEVNQKIYAQNQVIEDLERQLAVESASAKPSHTTKKEAPSWQNGLDEKEIKAVEAYIKRLKTIQKDAYDAEKAVQEALGRLNEFKTGDIEKIMADATSKDAPISKMLGVMTGMPVNDNAARKKAIESINPDQYKQITQQAEAAKKELDQQSNDIKAKWNDMAEAMLGVDAFKEVKPMNQRYVVKELEGYADTAKDAIDQINKQWLFGKVDEEKFSGKYAKQYIAALDAARELAESKRNAQVGEFDQDSIFSQFAEGQATLTQERVDQLHAEAAAYDELIARKMEYYGIKPKQGSEPIKTTSEESKPRQESHTTTSHSTTRPTVNGGTKTVTHTNESSSTTGGTTGVDSAIDGQNRLQGEMRETQQESEKTDEAIRKVGQGAQTGIMEGIGSGWIEYQKMIQEADKSILEFWADYNNLYREIDDDGNPFINWSDEESTLKRIGERLKEIYGYRSNTNFEKIYGNEAVALMDILKGAGHSVYEATNNKTIDKFFNNQNRFIDSRELLSQSSNLNQLLPKRFDWASEASSADEIIAFVNSLASSEQQLKEFKETLSSLSLEDLVSKFHELAGMEGTSERLQSIKDAIKAIVSTVGEIDEQRLSWLNSILGEPTSVEEQVGEISRLMDVIRNKSGNAIDLTQIDTTLTDIEAKMKKVREDFAQLFAEPISNNGTEEYYNGLYSQVENIGQAALELKNQLSGLEIPETATNLTGRKFQLENQFSWIEQAVAGRKGSIQQIYDSIDFEAQKAQRELEQRISARQSEITQRILGNADYKQYGEDTWLADYIEKAKTSTDEIDVIYAEFEQKLAERKQRIIDAEQLESQKQANKQEFISFLRGVSPTGDEEYTKNFEKYVDVFNSITHEVESLSSAIQKVKDDMASVEAAKLGDSNNADQLKLNIISITNELKELDAKYNKGRYFSRLFDDQGQLKEKSQLIEEILSKMKKADEKYTKAILGNQDLGPLYAQNGVPVKYFKDVFRDIKAYGDVFGDANIFDTFFSSDRDGRYWMQESYRDFLKNDKYFMGENSKGFWDISSVIEHLQDALEQLSQLSSISISTEFIDNTNLGSKEKLSEAKTFIESLQQQKLLEKQIDEAEENARMADTEDESGQFEIEAQNLGLKLADVEQKIESFKTEYQALKVVLKDGSEIIADASNFDSVLSGVDPKQIKEASLQYNELYGAIHQFEYEIGHLENIPRADSNAILDILDNGYTKEKLQEMYKMQEDEAQVLYDKIQYVNKNLFTQNGDIDYSSDAVHVYNEIADIIEKRYNEMVDSVQQSFGRVSDIVAKEGGDIKDYLDYGIINDLPGKITDKAHIGKEDEIASSAKSFAKNLQKDFVLSRGSVQELTDEINRMMDALARGEDIDTNGLQRIFEADRKLIELSEPDSISSQITKFLRGMKIQNLPDYKSEFGDDWNAASKALGFGVLKNRGGTDLITVLAQMNDAIGTTFDLTKPNAEAMVDLVNAIRSGATSAQALVKHMVDIGELNFSNIRDQLISIVDNIYPENATDRARSRAQASGNIWEGEDGFYHVPQTDIDKMYNVRSNATYGRNIPDELQRTARSLDDETLLLGLPAEEALDRLNAKAKELGLTFDETAQKWIQIGSAANTSPSSAVDSIAESEERAGSAAESMGEKMSDSKNAVVRSQEEIQAEIEETNKVIKIQEKWMKYLGDPNAVPTSTGKRDATDHLRNATNRLVNYRMHPENFFGQMDKEKITVGWWNAMQEAKRQGVADSVLARYDTDITKSHYEDALAKLQEELTFHMGILQESKDKLAQLQAELQQTMSGISQGESPISSGTDSTPSKIEEITDAENKMGDAGQSATDQMKNGLEGVRQEAEQTKESITSLEAYYAKYEPGKKQSVIDERIKINKNNAINQITIDDGAKGFIGKISTPTDKSGISQADIDRINSYTEVLQKLGYTLGEIEWDSHTYIASAKIIPIDGKAITDAEEMRRILFDIQSIEEQQKPSSPTTEQYKEEAKAAEEAAKAEEDLKQKRDEASQAGKSQDTSVEQQAADTAHEAAQASQEAADSYKNEAAAAEEAAKGNEDLAGARRNATENTPHGGKIDEILGLNGDANNRRRIIGEVGAEGASETGYTATYELSKGLTRTEVYGVPEGGGDVQPIASREVVNYNVLLKDTLSLVRQLSVAEAALNLERKKGSGPEVISAIENQIEYYKREIATNNALAQSYEDRSATISGDYTKEQYDVDVRERTEQIYLDTAKKSAQAIQSEYNRQAKDIAKTNTYVTNQLENLKNLQNRYDSSINPEAKKGITNQEDLNQFNEQVKGLRNFLDGLKNASLNPEDANRVIEMFGDLKRLGDNLYEKGMAGTGDLSQLNIESQKSILSDRISTFISRARRSDADVSDVIAKANELRDSLSGMDFGQQVTDGFTKLKELRAELDSINEQYKTIQSEVFGKIDAVFEARSKLNIAEAAQISGGETPTTVKNVTQAMEDLRVAEEAAAEAYVKLLEYFDQGYITEEQYLEAFNKFFSAGSDASVQAKEIAQLQAHTKAVAELAQSYIDLDNAKQKLDVSAMKNGGVADADTQKKYDEARQNNQRLLNELQGTFTQEDTDLLDKVKSDIAQQQRYRDNIGAIFALGEANNKYLNLDTQQAKGGTLGMGELSMALDNVKQKAIEAGDAFADLLKMFHDGFIDQTTFDNIQQLFFSDDIQKGSIKARTENERAHIDAQQKLVDELIKSYERLAAAEEKAQYGADAVARARGQKEVDKIKARQGEIQGDLAGTLSYEQAVNIHNAEKYHDQLASAYEQKRDAINFKGLAFDGTHDEKTWDTLINKAQQYQSILNKQNTKKPLSVSEAKILAQLGNLYEQAGNKAATAGEKGKEFTAAMDLAKKVVKEQTISSYDSIFGKMDSASADKPEEYNRLIGEIQKNIEKLRNTDLGTDAWNEEIKRLEENLRSINTDLNAKPVDQMAKESLNRKMSDWVQKNGRAGEYADQVRRLQDNLANVTNAGDLDRIAQGFERVKAEAADAGKVGQSFTAGLMKRFKSLGQYLLTYASFYRIIGTLKKAVSIVKELDSGLMEVRKVSTESLSTLQKWQQSTFKQADMVGGTATQIEKSTAAWIRLGKSFTEAQEAAQASVQLLNVSEFTNIDDATTSLVSMRQAFDDLTYGDFVDKLNAVGDNYSSATDQLAQGMQNVSSVLKTTGNDIDQSLALLTAAKIVGCVVQKYTSKNIFNCVDCLKAHSTITGKLRYDGLIMCA